MRGSNPGPMTPSPNGFRGFQSAPDDLTDIGSLKEPLVSLEGSLVSAEGPLTNQNFLLIPGTLTGADPVPFAAR